ncbi:MAG: YCF48-related protein [Bacteroidota bacterium]
MFIVNALTAQWELRYPDIPADQINDILFLNESTGFVVNSAGSVLMTTDGGNTWKIKAHYQRNVFSEIKFLDSQNGFAISPYSHIDDNISFIFTTDGGLHWDEGNVYMGDALAFLPLSSSVIIKSQTNGIISKLDNFFGHWTETYKTPYFFDIDVSVPFGSVVQFQRLPGGRILALGSSDAAKRAGVISDSVSYILKSDDAGSMWDTLWCGLPYNSQTISFFNDSVGWLGAESDRIYKTTDGGVTWTLQYSDSLHEYPVKSISSPDGINIFAVDGSGRVLYSTDSGQNWQFVQVDQYFDYSFTIKFLNSTKGFLAGPDFWVTSNGGITWKRVGKSLKGNFRKIDFASENIGMGVGGNSIYKTLDGGRSWKVLYESSSQSFSGLDMLDSLHVWITGYDSIFKSTDGGNSWLSFKLSNHIEQMRGIQFLDSSIGIVFEVWENDTTFNYVTTDAGNTWNKHTINNRPFISSLNKIKFTDPGHIWFANQDGAWLSRDTAKTWTLFPVEGASSAFDFVDSLNGWLSIWGGQYKKMAYTTDGGLTWEFVDKPYSSQTEDILTYREGNYFGGVVTVAAGDDGGLTQFRQGDSYVYDIPTYTGNTLFSIASYREGNTLNIWAAGVGMTLLHYTAFVTGIKVEMQQEISSQLLSQNYPNPFNPVTNISFSIPIRSFVSFKVYDLLGREKSTIVSEEMPAGNYTRQWNAAELPSGVYFYRLQAGSFTDTKKLVLLR